MGDFEKLGVFYLGRVCDPDTGERRDEPLLYESKDLTTHALCVGMTGSGKTGLCLSLLEEAAIDGVPAIAIDPKGDLGNLFLTFPELRPQDFAPWLDPAQAAREGMEPAELARATARRWREGLAEWDQDPARIRRLRDAAELALYTPGSDSGRPLRVLRSLSAPSAEVLDDPDALRERVEAAVSGLLTLLGVDADPLQSREHILLSNLVDRAWREGRDLELAALIGEIQKPPFEKLGVLDLESFFPAADRFAFSLRLNNLLASPGFAAWMSGEPLDVGRLLYTAEGRPRISVLSIAHLDDAQRMFFVTLLLNELISWMRAQPGTSSLRALLYMDEIFGYFPPSANPPSKGPMLTLLKQARAFGVGVVLATQNPVDLDYKGLSNCGTWFLGRLQTERDKGRVIEGLEGAAAAAGARLDRAAMDRILSGLGRRRFLMNNVHDDHPELFETRWALSFLSGPLTRRQIRELAAAGRPAEEPAPAAGSRAAAAPAAAAEAPPERPLLPPGVPECFVGPATPAPSGARLVWRPALLASAQLHFVKRGAADVDHWESASLLAALAEPPGPDPWAERERLATAPATAPEPEAAGRFAALPAAASRERSYASWRKRLASALYRDERLTIFHAPDLERWSRPGQEEGAFRAELVHAAREKRDLELEKLRKRYAPKLARLQDRIARAQEAVSRERDQARHQKLQTVVSVGATVLGALFGRKVASAGTVGRASTAARSASRASREERDVARAEARVEDLRVDLDALQEEFDAACDPLRGSVDPRELAVEPVEIRPRKSDLAIDGPRLAWTPWWVTPQGIATRAF
jgi:hypothetical protein